MGYIDIHSHILPFIDDGSDSIEESLQLLALEKENDVTSVICTPHFYAEAESFEAHIEKSQKAFALLKEATKNKELPQIFLGHEVQYFSGISKCQTLDKLCLNNTNILLLELPFLYYITDTMIDDIKKIYNDLGISIILAHIERYYNDGKFKSIVKLIESGIVSAQINADSLLNPLTKKTTLKLIKKGLVSYIASDTHSVKERPVLIKEALNSLKEKHYKQLVAVKTNCNNLEQIIKGDTNV